MFEIKDAAMFEIKDVHGYVQWSILKNRVARYCTIYDDAGNSIDHEDITESLITERLIPFAERVAEQLESVKIDHRMIYLANMPAILSYLERYTDVFQKLRASL